MAAFPPWTRADDKRFESALLEFNQDLGEVAYDLQKPLAEVEYYYDALYYDIDLIQSDKFVMPKYPDDDYVSETEAREFKYKDNERKKGIPWSEKEHGLVKYWSIN